MLRKAIGWIVVIFAAVWVSHDPSAAGNSVHHWIDSGIAFMQHLS
jgi:hypothetical protein